MTYKSKKELATAYQVCHKTLRKMILQVPQISANGRQHLLSPADCEALFQKFGNPYPSKLNKTEKLGTV